MGLPSENKENSSVTRHYSQLMSGVAILFLNCISTLAYICVWECARGEGNEDRWG